MYTYIKTSYIRLLILFLLREYLLIFYVFKSKIKRDKYLYIYRLINIRRVKYYNKNTYYNYKILIKKW
jgi:hypothetical protein